jgi:hypothetical protein
MVADRSPTGRRSVADWSSVVAGARRPFFLIGNQSANNKRPIADHSPTISQTFAEQFFCLLLTVEAEGGAIPKGVSTKGREVGEPDKYE